MLSKWKALPPLKLNHVGYTNEIQQKLNSLRDLNLIYTFVRNTGNFSDINRMKQTFIGSLFTKIIIEKDKVNEFKKTVALADILMHGDYIDGLLYPTLQMRGNADNFALKPRYVDNYLQFVNVEYIEISDANENKFSFNVLNAATEVNNKGEIVWLDRPLRWILNKKNSKGYFEFQSNGWICKNENGIISIWK